MKKSRSKFSHRRKNSENGRGATVYLDFYKLHEVVESFTSGGRDSETEKISIDIGTKSCFVTKLKSVETSIRNSEI